MLSSPSLESSSSIPSHTSNAIEEVKTPAVRLFKRPTGRKKAKENEKTEALRRESFDQEKLLLQYLCVNIENLDAEARQIIQQKRRKLLNNTAE